MKILLLSRYGRLGASSRVRFYQYLPYLKEAGIDVTVVPLQDDDYVRDYYAGKGTRWGRIAASYLKRLFLLTQSRRFDLLWVEGELFPWLPAWSERVLARFDIPYVVDYDDAAFHRYDAHSSSIVRALLGGKIDTVMRSAAMVIVGNDYLGEHARKAGARRVEYLPTVVDLERYPTNPDSRRDNAPFTIGWIGSPYTQRYLPMVRASLENLCSDGGVRVVLVGPRASDPCCNMFEVHPWREETEVSEILGFDVGIMPLPDDPWERGKCGYKLIQYWACGKPVVASPVGVNRQMVEDGLNGFLAENPEDWRKALTTLRDEPDLRKCMGKVGREKVEARYCLRVTAPRLVALLKDLTVGRSSEAASVWHSRLS